MSEEAVTWKQFRVRTNLGVLVSTFAFLAMITWQGFSIKSQIDLNTTGIDNLTEAITDFAETTARTNALDITMNQIYNQLDTLEQTVEGSRFSFVDVQANSRLISELDMELDDLRWRLDNMPMNEDGSMNQMVLDDIWHQINNLYNELDWVRNDMPSGDWADRGWVEDIERRINDMVWQMEDMWYQMYRVDDLQSQINDLWWELDNRGNW